MDDTEVSSFLSQRQEFELTETCILQEEEISRLKLNLNDLNKQIKQKKKEISKIHQRNSQKMSLVNELNSIIEETNSEIAKSNQSHLTEISSLKSSYSQAASSITDEFLQKERKTIKRNSKNSLIEKQKLEKMQEIVSNVLKEQEQLLEEHKVIEMSKYTDLAIQLRDKALKLKSKIAAAQEKLEATKENIKKKLNSTFNDISDRETLLETSILSFNDSINQTEIGYKGEINSLKHKHNEEIESLKQQIAQKTEFIENLRQKISMSVSSLTSVHQTFESLKSERDDLDSENTSLVLSFSKETIDGEIGKKQDIKSKILQGRKTIEKLKRDNDRLLNEVKRLDFLIYGRNGKYYSNEMDLSHRKPFVPVGIYAK
ncbi:hypothetical protein TVAG_047670 [Trichomonas vaginalis G3]|uniref:Uncharacterized protein n=1 Tax=Trichomonas vaginalis (strain ATCC PRA-98 / G3) TaxID=412133 RepID=A2FA92_TRIV3|nr:hypothetical protein TVAGG3_0485360 [Trichomonas vaginalis G3]EAX98166.1 hypothetical protein TVAG_047670 [Trichomonas vaginalis G3]KAI5516000.1 hypothetical protein TVAGG3_0485360 [Trichomonas vaginalis G3]|eukprot:XP_001311096.1 hypothetical protein [Trichomonas vaginalis G3]